MSEMKNKRKYQLDMAGKYFAGIMTANRRPLFAFAAVLAEPVDPLVLKQAVDQTLPRFPYFAVTLKSGLFWPYFQETELDIRPADNGGISFMPMSRSGPLFRISYHERKIYLEILHVLADGQGALTFMKTMLGQYFTLQGIQVPDTHGLFCVDDEPDDDEYADTIHRYCRPSRYRSGKPAKSYCLGHNPSTAEHALIATGIMKTRDVLDKAHASGASLTEYLAAVMAQSLMMQQLEDNNRKLLPVTINISTDLRRYYASKTLRNFSFHDSLHLDPTGGLEPFAEVLARFCRQRRAFFTEKNLNDRIGEILRYFSLVRGIPYLIKKSCRDAGLLAHRRADDHRPFVQSGPGRTA